MNLYKNILVAILLFTGYQNMMAGDPAKPYATSNIPASLIKNTNAVVRSDQMVEIVENINESKIKIKKVITLLNERASKERYFILPYDNFIKISNIKTAVYNSEGDYIPGVVVNVNNYSDNSGELATDSRYWIVDFPVRKYPYTIELEYEKTQTGSFNYDSWEARYSPQIAVEQSGFQLQIKKGLDIRIHGSNLKSGCDTTFLNDKAVYTWQVENMPATRKEDLYLLSREEKEPSVLLAPNNFMMNNLHGNMQTWETMGSFFYDLNKDRDQLSDEFKNKLHKMVDGLTTPVEKVRKLYEFLQNNTRYVSIQLGIGGFQTLEASFVEKKGYGDCKALTNYMKAMLKAVGIPSWMALIYTNDDIISDFPSMQFNHVVLCVPFKSDTLWLECTNQRYPFNYLGSDDGNKHVLLLTSDGGKLVKTPNYLAMPNTKSSSFEITLDGFGDAKIKGKQYFSGSLFENPFHYFNESEKEREWFINDQFSSPNIDIINLDYNDSIHNLPEFSYGCMLEVQNFSCQTKKRIIFNPFLYEPSNFIPKYEKPFDFEVSEHRIITDTMTFHLPYGYKVESLPSDYQMESKYGKVEWNCKQENGKLITTRRFEIYYEKYKAEDLPEFTAFFNKKAAIERKLVILQKE